MRSLNKIETYNCIKNNTSKIILILSAIFVGVFFYGLNALYPIYIDDWVYTYNFANGDKISSFTDIIQSQYKHYFEWGGRVVLHFIAQTLLWFGKGWADILNTLAYVGFVLILYFIANKKNKANPILFIYINIFIWFTLPSLSQNLLWKTGSANYLWGGLILFAFLYPFVTYYLQDEKSRDKLMKRIGLLLFGMLAGATNENMGLALIFFLIGLIILLKTQKKTIPQWMLWGLIGATIGCAFMLLSPGNAIRKTNDLWVAHKLQETDLSFYFYRFVTVTKLALRYILKAVGIYIVLLAIYWWKGRKEYKKEKLYLSLLFFCSSGVAAAAMSGSPMFPERAWFGILILLITACGILFANIGLNTLPLKVINYTLFTVIFVIYLFSCKENFTELVKFSDICKKRDKIIEDEKRKGEKDIVVADYFFQQKQSPFIVLDLQDWMLIDPGWSSRCGKYYGVNTVVFKNKTSNTQ